MNIIVIPVYNDWKSINHLLSKINRMLKFGNLVKILIINDCSTQKVNINKKNIKNIKEIKILSLKKNVGSQKSIAIGLNYLKKLKKDFYITVMDGDGEDNPLEIKKMLSKAKKNLNFIITSHRKKRNENFIIKFGYKIHLIISFLLTWNWISFGNFSCFHSSNLKKLLVNNNIWYAYSAGVIKNCKIKKLYATRQKRYFETLIIGIKTNTDDLREKIHIRLLKRMRQGMLDEVKKLHKKEGVSWKRLESLGLEYRYLAYYLQNKMSKREMLEKLEIEIGRYAKRQRTWFKRDKRIKWFSLKERDGIRDVTKDFLR